MTQSAAARFRAGELAGVVRLTLLGASIASDLHMLSGASASPLLALMPGIAGPLVTFAAIALAYRRFRNVPAAQEATARRPFLAWLPVAALDAAGLAILLVLAYGARDA